MSLWLNRIQNVQECDARGDQQYSQSPVHKYSLHYLKTMLVKPQHWLFLRFNNKYF